MINNPLDQLSEREKEVVAQLLQGKSNKLIALSLGISARTVEFHLKNVYEKFQVSSRIELILKLGNLIYQSQAEPLGYSTGPAPLEKLGYSPVENLEQIPEDRDGSKTQKDWTTPCRGTVSIIGKELSMKTPHTFYISNGILWASAIIASAIVGAPTVLSTVLLPALAVVYFLVIGPSLSPSKDPQ